MEITTKDKIENAKDIKIEAFRANIRKTNPHKHNKYVEIVYLYEGSGSHTIDYDTFEINQPTLFFIQKEQMHHWDILSEPKGFVIIMKKSFLENSTDQQLIQLIGEMSHHPCVYLKDIDQVNTIFQLLVDNLKDRYDTQQTVIEGLLKALFAKFLHDTTPSTGNTHQYSESFIQLKDLLESSEQIINSVNHYADLLHTTPQNLNAICKTAIGVSASKFIGEYIIKEAKRMLLYTNQTVSEIAFDLNFKDSSHFIRYFKRKTEMTPSNFRTS
ncbi:MULTISPECIES: helix-turn-helix transcriptional regulator [Flammeovirga]|uniref:Helix-turn-helix domain-containing protein n=1 Tax=Flammeovirga agarivorans TaxID=2726742 RepID=A0A7X8SG98_9BACT|nr:MULTISPECIES: helix-turn-helix transcriptional regulator [Flammeovirga]NLR89700.1 helix-turn-helix domain-containing protein [Flammeovirga agarivorans]